MTFYSAFQWNAFQRNAYQIADNDNETPGGAFIPSQQLERIARKKITKKKNDLDRVESVISETERKISIAVESKQLAQQRNALQRAIELEQLEADYLQELSRLLMVKAKLIRQVKQSEEWLVVIIAARRRRLRLVA